MMKQMKELKCNQELNLYYKKLNEHCKIEKTTVSDIKN